MTAAPALSSGVKPGRDATLAGPGSAGATRDDAEIGARLDRTPVTAFHRRLLLAIGAGLLVDGFDVYLAAGVAGALVHQGIAGLGDVAILVATTFVGLGIGGFVSGCLGDRIGRSRTMRWTLSVVALGSVGSALAQDLPQLFAWRFVAALGLGGETVLGYATLCELVPPDVRGRWTARLGLLANLGIPLSLFAGWLILPYPDGWRWMLAIPAAAALPVIWIRRNLVESPRWLAARGRWMDADRIVTLIERSAPGPLPAPHLPRKELEAPPSLLFGNAYRRRLLVGSIINIAVMSAVFGFVSWLPTFFASEGKDIASSVLFASLISIGSPVGVLLGMTVTDRIERRWGVVGFSLLVGLLGAAYAAAGSDAAILILGFLVVTAIYLAGTIGLTGYVPELFPTAVRMRSIGLCATAGRAVAIGMPFVTVPVFTTAGQAGVVALVSAILLVQALAVALWGPNTKGRPLETL